MTCILYVNLSFCFFMYCLQVVAAYEAGKKALDKQLHDNNLNTDRVTDVMLDLQEVYLLLKFYYKCFLGNVYLSHS